MKDDKAPKNTNHQTGFCVYDNVRTCCRDVVNVSGAVGNKRQLTLRTPPYCKRKTSWAALILKNRVVATETNAAYLIPWLRHTFPPARPVDALKANSPTGNTRTLSVCLFVCLFVCLSVCLSFSTLLPKQLERAR